jgi:sugar lactone lactonase YvrE
MESPTESDGTQELLRQPEEVDLEFSSWYAGPVTDSYAVETTIYAPLAWTDIAVWGGQIWALNNVTQEIVAFDSTGAVVDQIPYPDLPGDATPNLIGLTECQDQVWIADVGREEIYVVDLAGEVESSFPLGGGPQGMTCDGNSLWVVNLEDNALDRYNFEGNLLETVALRGGWITGVAWDGESLWYVDTPNASVWRYDPATGEHTSQDALTTLVSDMSFNGIAFTSSYLLWFEDMVGQLIAVER